MKNFKYLFPLLSLIFIFGVSALATYGLSDNLQSASNLREASLQTRASKIFSLDAHKKNLIATKPARCTLRSPEI